MIRALCLLIASATPAWAAFDITTRHGNWEGSGEVLRGDSLGTIRCRVTLAPEGAATIVSGRCAVPEGGVEIGLKLTPQPDGSYVAEGHGVEPDTTTRIETLTGTPADNALTLRGEAPGETATLQFVPLENGGLRIATERLTRSGRRDVSSVDLVPR